MCNEQSSGNATGLNAVTEHLKCVIQNLEKRQSSSGSKKPTMRHSDRSFGKITSPPKSVSKKGEDEVVNKIISERKKWYENNKAALDGGTVE